MRVAWAIRYVFEIRDSVRTPLTPCMLTGVGYSFVCARSIRRFSTIIISVETFEGKSAEAAINMVCSSFVHLEFEVTMLIGAHRFFDASKQVWGSVLVHIANLLL